jgi:branched-chain amino acid transport system permease protein
MREPALLAVAFAAVQLAPRHIGLGVYAVGLSTGAVLALHALAVLLLYRANRFVAFSQVQLASLASVVFVDLVQGRRLLEITRSACGCIGAEPGGFAKGVNFTFAVAVSITLTVAASWLIGQLVIRRFAAAPRIVCSLATVFAAQVLIGLRSSVDKVLLPKPVGAQTAEQLTAVIEKRTTRPPGDFVWRIDALGVLRLADVLLITAAVVALVALAIWLGRTRAGAELRAASERPARAETLGVDVAVAAGRAWLLAGALAGLVGVATGFGRTVRTVETPEIASLSLCLVLVALLFGRFQSLGATAGAALVLGLVQQAVRHGFQSTAPLEALLPVLVGAALLLQRERPSRAEIEAEAAGALADEVRPVPPELRPLPQVRTWTRLAVGAAAVLLLGLPWALPPSTVTTAAAFVILTLVGLSLLVLTGWAGQLSLGQMGVAAAGGWAAAVTGLPAPLALLVGGVVGAGVSALVGLPALRLRTVHVAVMTLSFALSARAVFAGQDFLGAHTPRLVARPVLVGMDFNDPRAFYYGVVVVAAAACAAVVGLRRSRTGRVLIATRGNPAAAAALGVNALRARLSAFAVAGFLCGVAGVLLVFHQRGLLSGTFSPDASLSVFLYAVVGGLGGVAGPLFGFAFEALLTLFSTNPLLVFAATGMGGILLLTAAPGGIAQLVYGGRDAGLRRLAIRHRIDVPALLGRRQSDKSPLRERRSPAAMPVAYDLPHQWALDARARQVLP